MIHTYTHAAITFIREACITPADVRFTVAVIWTVSIGFATLQISFFYSINIILHSAGWHKGSRIKRVHLFQFFGYFDPRQQGIRISKGLWKYMKRLNAVNESSWSSDIYDNDVAYQHRFRFATVHIPPYMSIESLGNLYYWRISWYTMHVDHIWPHSSLLTRSIQLHTRSNL